VELENAYFDEKSPRLRKMTRNHTKMVWKHLRITKKCVLESVVAILTLLKKNQKNIPNHKDTTKVNALRSVWGGWIPRKLCKRQCPASEKGSYVSFHTSIIPIASRTKYIFFIYFYLLSNVNQSRPSRTKLSK